MKGIILAGGSGTRLYPLTIEEKPEVIIHCAAYTVVDKAEYEKGSYYSVNVEGTRAVAEVAKKINTKSSLF